MKLESKTLEFKEAKTNTYLKTVSAFANYNDGEIRFGVTDEGKVMPIDDMNAFALDIENQINDSFNVRPYFSILQNPDKTVSVFVKKGYSTPYLYKGKAYKRSDTSTIEVDSIELKRLILEGLNQTYDELPTVQKNLSFDILSKQIKKELKISDFNEDILKSLNLLVDESYNNAAALVSDENAFPGLDIAVFGDSIDIIKERHTLSGVSLIKQFYDSIEIFNRIYTYEQITGAERVKRERIPTIAFREMIANAIIHRTYDVNANTKVSMFPDRIEISSPGGLMRGISKEKFLSGAFSVLRNPIVAEIFKRIRIVEAFATGIKRTNNAYAPFSSKPVIDVDDCCISVMLPAIDCQNSVSLKHQEIVSAMGSNIKYNRQEFENLFGLSKDNAIRLLNALIDEGLIVKEGSGKSVRYRKK